jgi:dihydrofolate reductase
MKVTSAAFSVFIGLCAAGQVMGRKTANLVQGKRTKLVNNKARHLRNEEPAPTHPPVAKETASSTVSPVASPTDNSPKDESNGATIPTSVPTTATVAASSTPSPDINCISDKAELYSTFAKATSGDKISLCSGTIVLEEGDPVLELTADAVELVCSGDPQSCILDGGRLSGRTVNGRIMDVLAESFIANGVTFQNAESVESVSQLWNKASLCTLPSNLDAMCAE